MMKNRWTKPMTSAISPTHLPPRQVHKQQASGGPHAPTRAQQLPPAAAGDQEEAMSGRLGKENGDLHAWEHPRRHSWMSHRQNAHGRRKASSACRPSTVRRRATGRVNHQLRNSRRREPLQSSPRRRRWSNWQDARKASSGSTQSNLSFHHQATSLCSRTRWMWTPCSLMDTVMGVGGAGTARLVDATPADTLWTVACRLPRAWRTDSIKRALCIYFTVYPLLSHSYPRS